MAFHLLKSPSESRESSHGELREAESSSSTKAGRKFQSSETRKSCILQVLQHEGECRIDDVTEGSTLAFADEDTQELLTRELHALDAESTLPSPKALTPRLSALLLTAVTRASYLCAAYDSERGGGDQAPESSEAADHITSVVAAAEEARTHNWTFAGCDTLLKLLVATAVQVSKQKELFSPDVHASFL